MEIQVFTLWLEFKAALDVMTCFVLGQFRGTFVSGHMCIYRTGMRGGTAEGAHLLLGLFLVAADLQVVLQHSAEKQKDTCWCSRDLLSAYINLDIPFEEPF